MAMFRVARLERVVARFSAAWRSLCARRRHDVDRPTVPPGGFCSGAMPAPLSRESRSSATGDRLVR
jgi:hypothetical protein